MGIHNGKLTSASTSQVWATGQTYGVNDVVVQSSLLYICLTAHTSGTFATDLAALKWVIASGGASVSSVNLMVLDTNFLPNKTDNSTAALTVGDWVTYKDAVAEAPVDMDGAGAAISITRRVAAPATNGGTDFDVTIPSGVNQGEGVSCTVNIPGGYQYQKLIVKAAVKFSTPGVYFPGDIVPYAYHIGNSTLITPTPINITNNWSTVTGGMSFILEFDGLVSTSQIRVGFHIAKSSTYGSTQHFYFTDVSVTPYEHPILNKATGIKNYIKNPNFNSGSTLHWTFGTATLTSNLPTGVPTFGSGHSANLSKGAAGSFLMSDRFCLSVTSAAATTPGDFLSTLPMTIDPSDQAKILNFSFNYKQAGGTAANFSGTNSNSFGVAIYDVTNSAWIIPAGVFNLVQGTGIGRCTGTFQTPSNIASLRLVIFNANATPSTCQMYFDDFVLGPQITVNAPAMSDWVAYTPTFSAAYGTCTSVSFFWRRNGDSVDIKGSAAAGTVAGGVGTITLPSGLTPDSAKLSSLGTLVGTSTSAATNTVGVLNGVLLYIASGGTVLRTCNVGTGAATGNLADVPPGLGTGNSFSINASVPISGWSSNSVMSQDTDTRVVAASYYVSSNFAASTTTPINFDTKIFDTHNAVTPSPTVWKFTAPVSGIYNIGGMFTITTASGCRYAIWKNGSILQAILDPANATYASAPNTNIQLNAGDYIEIRLSSALTIVGGSLGATDTSVISIFRLSGPAVVAASEKIYLQYTGNAGGSVTANVTNIDFSTKVVDSHGAWNGTTFTPPRAGWYNVSGATNVTTGDNGQPVMYLNGSSKQILAMSATDNQRTFSTHIYLLPSDSITFRYTTTRTLNNAPTGHYISISSQG